jgi:hypothetical protein
LARVCSLLLAFAPHCGGRLERAAQNAEEEIGSGANVSKCPVAGARIGPWAI